MLNISSQPLTCTQTQVLSKGLTFCPTVKTDWFQLELDLYEFLRKLKLKICFSGKDIDNVTSDTVTPVFCLKNLHLKTKSEFSPTVNSAALDMFHKVVKNYIESLRRVRKDSLFHYPNMTCVGAEP